MLRRGLRLRMSFRLLEGLWGGEGRGDAREEGLWGEVVW